MKSVKKIIMGIILMGIAIFISGCVMKSGFRERTLIFEDAAVISTYVTSTPENAKLTLINLDRGIGPRISSSLSPNVIHRLPLPFNSAFLLVSYPGYKTHAIRLNQNKKRIHVKLELDLEGKDSSVALKSLSSGLITTKNLPDVSSIVDEESIPNLIDEKLAINIPGNELFMR